MNPQEYNRVVSNFKADNNMQNRLKQKILTYKKEPFYKRVKPYRYGLSIACLLIIICGIFIEPKISTFITQAISSRNSSHTTAQEVIYGPYLTNPGILNYNHRLYSNSDIYKIDNTTQKGDYIGHVLSDRFESDAYTTNGISSLNSICIPCIHFNSKFAKYDYLCDETISVQGRTYFMDTDNKLNGVCLVSNSQSQDSSSNKNSQINSNTYLLQLILYPKISPDIKSIVNKVIVQIPNGNIYSIDEINPEEAIAINANNEWFIATKEYGYSGKTINDVINDKGIPNSVIY